MTRVHYAGDETLYLTEHGIVLTPGMPEFELAAAILAALPAWVPLAAPEGPAPAAPAPPPAPEPAPEPADDRGAPTP